MSDMIFAIGSTRITVLHLFLSATALALILLCVLAAAVLRANRERILEAAAASARQRELDDRMAEINRAGAELTGRMQTMAEVLSSRQSDFARLVSERLDAVGTRVGQGLE